MTAVQKRHASPARLRGIALVGAVVGILSVPPALGCFVLTGSVQGFTVQHALSLPVSLSTRQAIVAGELEDIPRDTTAARTAALQQLVAIVGLFGKVSERHDSASAVPDFAVLLTESGLWTGFNALAGQGWQVRQHLEGPAAQDVVIVVSDPAMAALLKGNMTVAQAADKGLLRTADGSAESEHSLEAFAALVERFAESPYAKFRLKDKLPSFGFAEPLSSVTGSNN